MANTALTHVRKTVGSKLWYLFIMVRGFVKHNKMEIAIIVLLYVVIEIKDQLKKSNKTLSEFMRDMHFG